MEELQKSAQASQMKARGAQLTGSRMLSKKQVVEHLTRRGGDREAAEDTALWLEELGAVDEAAYGAAIVRHYSASGYGPGRIRQELSHRGIPRDLWEELLSQMPPAEEAADALTLEAAINFLEGLGYPTTPSNLYNLAYYKRIPYRKVRRRLLFSRKELTVWVQNQIEDPAKRHREAAEAIAESANRK